MSFALRFVLRFTLQHASFKINAGQLVGFVGASGCGKSTIVRLLLRYYDVTSGEVRARAQVCIV